MKKLITTEIQQKVDAVNRAKDEAAYSWVNLGKRLFELKEVCQKGTFNQIAEDDCGLKKSQCYNLIKIYETYGENSSQLEFSQTILVELASAPDPQAALQEASKQKTLTAKQAKELVIAHRKIKILKEQATPSLSKLIPELLSLHKSGGLPEATALDFSKLSKDVQEYVVLPKFQELKRLQADKEMLEKEKAEANEKLLVEKDKSDKLQADFNEAVGLEAQEIIAEKDRDIARKEKELDHLKIEIREEIEKDTMARLKEGLISDHKKETDKLKNSLKSEKDRADRILTSKSIERQKRENVEAELANLNEKLNASDSVTKDVLYARDLAAIIEGIEVKLNIIQNDTEFFQRRFRTPYLEFSPKTFIFCNNSTKTLSYLIE